MQCIHIKEWMQHKFVCADHQVIEIDEELVVAIVCADHQVIEIDEELVVAIVNYAPSLIRKQIMYLSSTV